MTEGSEYEVIHAYMYFYYNIHVYFNTYPSWIPILAILVIVLKLRAADCSILKLIRRLVLKKTVFLRGRVR